MKAVLVPHAGVTCLSYVIEEDDRLPSLDGAAARRAGARGAQLGELKQGKDVRLADGTIIKATDVCGARQPGRRVVYVTDTSDASPVRHLAAGADLVVHEATMPHIQHVRARQRGHSTAGLAARFARGVSAAHLILMHFGLQFELRGVLRRELDIARSIGGDRLSVSMARDFCQLRIGLRRSPSDPILIKHVDARKRTDKLGLDAAEDAENSEGNDDALLAPEYVAEIPASTAAAAAPVVEERVQEVQAPTGRRRRKKQNRG
jgi:hypothetical protein